MKRKDGERGLKSLREVYEGTRLRVRCYMFVSDNKWIKDAWKQDTRKECNSIKDEIIWAMQTKGKTIQFEGYEIRRKNIGQRIQTDMETSKKMLQKR